MISGTTGDQGTETAAIGQAAPGIAAAGQAGIGRRAWSTTVAVRFSRLLEESVPP